MLYILYTAILIIAGVTLLVILMRNKSIRQGERIAREMVDNEGKKAELAHERAEPKPEQAEREHDREAKRAREESEQPPRTPPTPPPVPPVPPMP